MFFVEDVYNVSILQISIFVEDHVCHVKVILANPGSYPSFFFRGQQGTAYALFWLVAIRQKDSPVEGAGKRSKVRKIF